MYWFKKMPFSIFFKEKYSFTACYWYYWTLYLLFSAAGLVQRQTSFFFSFFFYIMFVMGRQRKMQRTHDLRLFRGIISPRSPPCRPRGGRGKNLLWWMWRQWRSFYISVRWPHCDTAAALRLQSAMNKLQMAARSPSFILYFQWSWQMVWKDYQHPLAVACASEIDVIISKRMLQWWKIIPKTIIFLFTCRLKLKYWMYNWTERDECQGPRSRAHLISHLRFIILRNYIVWLPVN